MVQTSSATTKCNPSNDETFCISRPKELFLLFHPSEFDIGREMFQEAAQTRLKNIKNSDWFNSNIHKVHNPPFDTLQEIQVIINNWINRYGGKSKAVLREIGIFSHSGTDGPIIYDTPNYPPLTENYDKQMHINGWKSIKYNWAQYVGNTKNRLVFYGCNSAKSSNSFAKRISNYENVKDVEVIGQPLSSFPSFVPDYRVTNLDRNLNAIWIGHTYLVSSKRHQSIQATIMSPVPIVGYEPSNYPKAEQMRFYKNNILIMTSHQGIFNDHRKTTQ